MEPIDTAAAEALERIEEDSAADLPVPALERFEEEARAAMRAAGVKPPKHCQCGRQQIRDEDLDGFASCLKCGGWCD